jgi:hypothetical protein
LALELRVSDVARDSGEFEIYFGDPVYILVTRSVLSAFNCPPTRHAMAAAREKMPLSQQNAGNVGEFIWNGDSLSA